MGWRRLALIRHLPHSTNLADAVPHVNMNRTRYIAQVVSSFVSNTPTNVSRRALEARGPKAVATHTLVGSGLSQKNDGPAQKPDGILTPEGVTRRVCRH